MVCLDDGDPHFQAATKGATVRQKAIKNRYEIATTVAQFEKTRKEKRKKKSMEKLIHSLVFDEKDDNGYL